MYRMFEECTAFNQNIENWDVSKVTDMGSMFKDATSFNQPIGNWNVSNEKYMFYVTGAKSFNQPLNGWNVGNVKDMRWVFSVHMNSINL